MKSIIVLAIIFGISIIQPISLLAQESTPRLSISSSDDQVTINWTAVDNAIGYKLYFAAYPYKPGDSIGEIEMGNILSFNVSLWDGTAYYVAIQSYTDANTTAYSNIEYFVLDPNHISFSSFAGSFNGLTLISPMGSTTTYLIDDLGQSEHQWESNFTPALSVYLLENGHLLRTGKDVNSSFNVGGQGGYIEEMDWNGNLIWQFKYSDTEKVLYHDIKRMANGNILALSWELKDTVWTEVIIEIEKQGNTQGNIVWRWDIWDHLTELGLDSSNARTEDWIHLNSIDYNEASNQIMVSSRSHSQVWVINKNDGSIETVSSVNLKSQHDAKWIDVNNAASNITIFDNGQIFSRSLEVDSRLKTILWSYGNATTEYFFADHISGTQRLSNGNTLVCSGVNAIIFELDSAGNKIREYISSYIINSDRGENKQIFRAEKYSTGFTPYF